MSFRNRLRHAALDALAVGYAVGGRYAALREPRVQFVYTHDVDESTECRLRAHVTRLALEHEVVSYAAATEAVCAGQVNKPTVCFSLDDGFVGCLRAAKVFQEFGVRACFFVCAQIIGETEDRVVERFCVEQLRTAPNRFMSWRDLESLLAAGHEIGCHTRSHPDLATISRQELEDEIGGAKALIEHRLGPIRHFAWPFGRFENFSSAALAAVARAGFASCASAERGAHRRAERYGDVLLLRRDNLESKWPPRHVRYFLARNAPAPDAPFPSAITQVSS